MDLMFRAAAHYALFPIEHAELERKARNHRLAATPKPAQREQPTTARTGFIPRLAGALGLVYRT